MVKHWRLETLKGSVEHFFLVFWLGFAPKQMNFWCLIPPEMQYGHIIEKLGGKYPLFENSLTNIDVPNANVYD